MLFTEDAKKRHSEKLSGAFVLDVGIMRGNKKRLMKSKIDARLMIKFARQSKREWALIAFIRLPIVT